MAHSPVIFYYILFFAAGAFILYQGDRAFSFSPEDGTNVPDRESWFRVHRFYVRTSIVTALVGVAIASWHLPGLVVAISAMVGLAGVLHALPAFGGKRRFKSFGVLKTLAITGSWIVGGIVIPISFSGVSTSHMAIMAFLVVYRIPIILSNLLVSDFLDRQGDLSEGLKSVGYTISWPRLRFISRLLLMFSIIVGIAGVLILGDRGPGLVLLVVDLCGTVFLFAILTTGARMNRERLFMMDILVGWPVVTYLGSILLS